MVFHCSDYINSAVATASASLNGRTYNFAGTNSVGTVSAGDSDKERTITQRGSRQNFQYFY